MGGDLGATAKDTIKDTVTGTQQVGGNIIEAIEDTTRGLIRGASDVDGDVANVAKNAVEERHRERQRA